jgi:hypothetical protein
VKAEMGSVHPKQGFARYQGQLRREQLGLLHRVLPVVLAANLINGSLIVALFADRIAGPLLAGWWLLLIAMTAVRLGIWFWYRNRSATEQTSRRWGILSILGSAASGLLWGTAGVLFYVPGDSHLVVLGFVLGGMGAGAVASLTPYIWAFYAYLIPSVLPFTIKLALLGGVDHWGMAAMCVLYVLSLMFLGWRAHCWLTRSLILGFEKASFVQTLQERVEERTEELREISERLSRDVADRQRAEAKLSDYGYRQAAVADFGQRALSGVGLAPLFSEAVSLVAGGFGAAGAAILELSSDRQMLFVRTAVGAVFAHGVESPLLAGTGSPGGFAVQEQAPAVSDDLGSEHRFAVPAMLRHAGVASIAAVAIADAGDFRRSGSLRHTVMPVFQRRHQFPAVDRQYAGRRHRSKTSRAKHSTLGPRGPTDRLAKPDSVPGSAAARCGEGKASPPVACRNAARSRSLQRCQRYAGPPEWGPAVGCGRRATEDMQLG